MKRLLLISMFFLVLGCDSGSGDPGGGTDTPTPGEDTLPAEDTIPAGDAEPATDIAPAPDTVEEIVEPPACEGAPVLRALSQDGDETFDLGPYVMNVTRGDAVIMWRTLDAADSKVVYRAGADGEEQEIVVDTPVTIHEIPLTDLGTDTEVTYHVESGGVASQEHVFRTAPLPGTPVRFVGWADSQSGWEVFTEQVPLLVDDGPSFVIGVGDLVSNGKNDPDWKEQLFGPARPLLHQIPLFAAIGNHEGNSHNWYDLLSYPYPDGDPDHESYYSYSWGNVFAVVIDPYKLPCAFGGVDTPHSAWLKEVVASEEAQAATWRIAYAHEPAVSESWGDGSCTYHGNSCVREGILPLLAAHGFHAYFAGHTHAWERGEVAGMVHLIMGGGGGHTDAWCWDLPETEIVHTAHHHVRVDAGCDTLRIEGVGLDGQVFDWVEIAATSPVTVIDEGPAAWIPAPDLNSDRPLD